MSSVDTVAGRGDTASIALVFAAKSFSKVGSFVVENSSGRLFLFVWCCSTGLAMDAVVGVTIVVEVICCPNDTGGCSGSVIEF